MTTIAVAGKGGTGKTTVAALLIRYLVEQERGAVLAIDADPSSNLHYVLGLELEETIGDIREGMLELVQANAAAASALPGGMSKQDYLDYQIRMALVEGGVEPDALDVDLLAMGRPEGPGCYCAANQMMRVIMDHIGDAYDYVVMDNEAGMEHISRRTTRDVKALLLVTDPSQRGIITAQRIIAMIPDLDINVESVYVVLNRFMSATGTDLSVADLPPGLRRAVEGLGVPLLGVVPHDSQMAEFEFTGQPLIKLPLDSAVVRAVYGVAEQLEI